MLTRAAFVFTQVLVKYPTKYEECLNTVLSQECIRYNSLITVMLSTLALSVKALKGLVVMSPELDSVCDAIFNNQVSLQHTCQSARSHEISPPRWGQIAP